MMCLHFSVPQGIGFAAGFPITLSKEIGIFTVTGSTGQVESVVAQSLLAKGAKLRAVVRNIGKSAVLAQQGLDSLPRSKSTPLSDILSFLIQIFLLNKVTTVR